MRMTGKVAPMVALMRYHSYNRRRTTEMVGTMIGPPVVLIALVLCDLSAFRDAHSRRCAR